eukprot:sb/3476282/
MGGFHLNAHNSSKNMLKRLNQKQCCRELSGAHLGKRLIFQVLPIGRISHKKKCLTNYLVESKFRLLPTYFDQLNTIPFIGKVAKISATLYFFSVVCLGSTRRGAGKRPVLPDCSTRQF